ncbi:hypothetical protein P7K49_019839 [Saguinus oedipus]|uniref:Transcription factor JunD n=1 Tax=Saguinus oedipus TaxID=9490 RepID=A0ABQ9V112_SAGOE|nr:hypothetical protein P7K49_019839 [Saguinus oedipus]
MRHQPPPPCHRRAGPGAGRSGRGGPRPLPPLARAGAAGEAEDGNTLRQPFDGDEALSGLGSGDSDSEDNFASLGRLFPGAAGSMMKKDAPMLSLSVQVAAALKPTTAPPPTHLRTTASPPPSSSAFIIQSNRLVITTPTSTQFLYAKEFAEGFKALEDLHKENQLGPGADAAADAAGGPSGTTAGSAPPPPPRRAGPGGGRARGATTRAAGRGGRRGAGGVATVPFAAEPVPFPPPRPPRLAALKEDPQTVPDLSLIIMDTQERIKAERKRLRNRIAASKCRNRKLKRISRLEEKVKTLKSQNTELASTASLLCDSSRKSSATSTAAASCGLSTRCTRTESARGGHARPPSPRGGLTGGGVVGARNLERVRPWGPPLPPECTQELREGAAPGDPLEGVQDSEGEPRTRQAGPPAPGGDERMSPSPRPRAASVLRAAAPCCTNPRVSPAPLYTAPRKGL